MNAPDPFDQPYIDLDRVAVVTDTGESVTYRDFVARTRRLAGLLRARGLAPGDVVAVLSENSPQYLEMTWACRLAGLYFVTVNSHLSVDEIAYIINDSGAVAVIASSQVDTFAGLTSAVVPAVALRLLRGEAHDGWDDYEAAVAAAADYVSDTEVEGDILQYSSGTTGRPKGIKRNLRVAPASLNEDTSFRLVSLIGTTSESVFMTPAPLYHTAPIMWTMAVLRVGGTVVLLTRFDPEVALSLIERHRVTHGQFVPTMFVRMLKLPDPVRARYDISSLQGVVHAAAPCPIEIKRAMIQWWGQVIFEYWSSSEGAGMTFLSAAEWLEHPGSVGRPIMGEVHICDEHGQELPVGETGMIWAATMTTFAYLNDPTKDAETTNDQGWRTVGDVGRFDEDGYLYLTDRASFMIISGGVNIYPQEAENALIEHPNVYDAAVIGVPDDDLGEVPLACVQLVEDVPDRDAFAAELLSWCYAKVAKYKCPRRIEFFAELPRTDTGKLMKRLIRDQYIKDHANGTG